jgi:hypothetical protein
MLCSCCSRHGTKTKGRVAAKLGILFKASSAAPSSTCPHAAVCCDGALPTPGTAHATNWQLMLVDAGRWHVQQQGLQLAARIHLTMVSSRGFSNVLSTSELAVAEGSFANAEAMALDSAASSSTSAACISRKASQRQMAAGHAAEEPASCELACLALQPYACGQLLCRSLQQQHRLRTDGSRLYQHRRQPAVQQSEHSNIAMTA